MSTLQPQLDQHAEEPTGPALELGLTVREHMLLAHAELRGDWYVRGGLLRHVFGATPTQVHAELAALIDRADAEATYPVLVHRLRRLRAARHQQRSPARIA